MDINTFNETIKNQITMDRNQFYYIRKELIDGTSGDPKFREFIDGFNINKVIRSIQMEDGRLIILLDDIHERSQEVPAFNPKTGKQTGFKRERGTFQTEVYLEGDDIERFRQLTGIDSTLISK